MIKKALIFVPHPDDEINLAGGIIETLYNNGVHTTVVISTNGDCVPENTSKRYYEALKAQKVLKYQELIFLGYGDGYIGTHIYDAKENEVVQSISGNTKTYCAGNIPEFYYSKTQVHHDYVKANYKEDIKSVIYEQRADLIICVDIDAHLDHKCLSLLFDECMGELLKSECQYRPIILKGFAYNGVWSGPSDFFDVEIKPSTIVLLKGESIERKCFPYLWEDRIRLKCSSKSQSYNLLNNTIFKALWAHKTQSDYYKVGFCALSKFPKIANPDSCYWYRNPYNWALYSQIEVTSGDAHYLNDFILAKPRKTIAEDLAVESLGWTPGNDDKEPTITITFPRQICLSEIRIYNNMDSKICRVWVKLDTGYEAEYKCKEGIIHSISIPSVRTNRIWLKVFALDNRISINEIECYENNMGFPWKDFPVEQYIDNKVKRSKFFSYVVGSIYKIIIKIVLLFSLIKSII